MKPFEKARFLAPECLHLTLHFLGSTPAEKIAGVVEKMVAAASKVRPHTQPLREFAAFPNLSHAGVAGIADKPPVPELLKLWDLLGPPNEERPLWPHITLVRFGRRAKLADSSPVVPVELKVTAITLFESHPGSDYRALEEFPLAPIGSP